MVWLAGVSSRLASEEMHVLDSQLDAYLITRLERGEGTRHLCRCDFGLTSVCRGPVLAMEIEGSLVERGGELRLAIQSAYGKQTEPRRRRWKT